MKKIKTLILMVILICGICGTCVASTLALPPAQTGLVNTAGNALSSAGITKVATSVLGKNPLTGGLVTFFKVLSKPMKTAAGEAKTEWKYGPVNHWTVTTFDTKTTTSDKTKHNFGNSFTCKSKCGYECDEYKDSKWGYKFKDGKVSTKMCIRYCSYEKHDHGKHYDKKSSHTDDGTGKCKTCKYPCVGGTHNYNSESKCTKCGYYSSNNDFAQSAEEVYDTAKEVVEENTADIAAMEISTGNNDGCLIINADHDNIRRDAIKSIEILLDGNKIIPINDSDISNASTYNDVKYIFFEDGELQIMDKRIALIVKPGTNLAREIGDVSHTITLKVYDENKSTSDKWREETEYFNGIFKYFESATNVNTEFEENIDTLQISTEEGEGYLIINIDNKDINVDNIKSVSMEIDDNIDMIPYNMASLPIQNDAKIAEFRGSEIQFMYQRVSLIIRQGEELANILGNTEKEIIFDVFGFNEQSKQGRIKIKGIFTPTQPEEPVQPEETVQPEEPVQPEKSGLFSDIMKDSYLEVVVKYVVDKKIMNGMDNTTFAPEGNVTREQLATILSRVPVKTGLNKNTQKKSYNDEKLFKDWASEAIKYFGAFIDEDDDFMPDAYVNKKETILALVKMFKLNEKIMLTEDIESEVNDILKKEGIKNADDVLKTSLGFMLQYKILQKDTNGKVKLEGWITRGELATLIYKFYNTEIEVLEKCTEKNCTGFIIAKWEASYKNHWKKCSNGHKVVKETPHDKNAQVCSICNYDKKAGKILERTGYIEPKFICVKCKNGKTIWMQKETFHIAVCKKDNSHIIQIEEHKFDSKNQCTVCGMITEKQYKAVYNDYTDTTNWAWRNVGNMLEKGVLRPKEDNDGEILLRPDDNISVEQFIALFARVLGYEEQMIADGSLYIPMKGINDFWSENEWKFLMQKLGSKAKAEMQILLGDGSNDVTDKTIADNYKLSITREKVAYLLGGFFKSKEINKDRADTELFEDWDQVNKVYAYRLETLSAYDILKGKISDEGKLYIAPNEYLTKLEAIALIDRFYSIMNIGLEY